MSTIFPKKEKSTSVPNWVLEALPSLSNNSDTQILIFLAARSRYRNAAYGPGALTDELQLDSRTIRSSLKRLREFGYIVSGGGVHSLRGACAKFAQPLSKQCATNVQPMRKSTPKQTDENSVSDDKSEKPTLDKDSNRLKRTSKDSSKQKPPIPQGEPSDLSRTVEELKAEIEQLKAKPKRKSKSKAKDDFDPHGIDLPTGIERKIWVEWCAHRKAKRKALTERSATQTLNGLKEALKHGWDANCLLRDSIANDWTGCVFEKHKAPNPNIKMPVIDPRKINDQDGEKAQIEIDIRYAAQGIWIPDSLVTPENFEEMKAKYPEALVM